MDQYMVFGYVYCRWRKQQWYQHVPPLLAILMAVAVRQCSTKCIAQCSMSSANLEATGCQHQATTRYVSPQRPPGQQANKQQSTNTPTKLAVSMAMAMCWYIIACIAQWRRSKALLEATGRCRWASIVSDNIKRTWLQWFFWMFSSSKL